MGIDLLRNCSESIPMGTYSRMYKFAATPGAPPLDPPLIDAAILQIHQD